MFEKDAKEYAMHAPPPFSVARDAFQKGAEFGYNKGYHDAEEHYMNVIDSQHKLVEESKAKEWHYPSKGELPGESEEEIKEKGEKVYAIFKNNSYYIIDRAAVKNYEDLIAWTELPTFTKA